MLMIHLCVPPISLVSVIPLSKLEPRLMMFQAQRNRQPRARHLMCILGRQQTRPSCCM
jgi:hypothetical protein